MAARDALLVYRMLEGWPYPATSQVATPFSAPWSSTVDLLRREADFLGAPLVIVELDVSARAIRRDDGLRADARPFSEKVRITLETRRRGTLSWHTDRYVLPRGGGLGWRENARAIGLTMEALRAVERYGATHSSEQYQGFLAIEAAPAATGDAFDSADSAARWLIEHAPDGAGPTLDEYVRAARAAWHPDRQRGDRTLWDRLERAAALMRAGGLLAQDGGDRG